MTDVEVLELVQRYLAAPSGAATDRENTVWRAVYKSYDPMIRAVLRCNYTGQGDVDDLDQDVWYALVRRLPTLRLDPALGTLRNWVRAIARKQADWHARHETGQTVRVLTAESAALLLDPETGPVAALDRKQQQEQVHAIFEQVIATLPEQSCHIVLMHWATEQTVAEIAAELCLTKDTVKAIIRRATRKLGEAPRREGLGPSKRRL